MNDFDEEFMYYKLTEMNLNRFANHNAQPVISGQKIYALTIPFPPLPEQQRIATILSDFDNKIDKYIQQRQDFI